MSMHRKPLDPDSDGAGDRDASGRFAPGNAASKGNPYAKRVNQLRAALMEAITDEDFRQIVLKLVEQAKSGDMVAIKELLMRTLGRPLEPDLIERIEAIEAALTERDKR